MLPAIILPIVMLIAASDSLGFARIGVSPTSMLQLLEALLPASARPAPSVDWTPLGSLLDLQQSRALAPAGAALLIAMVLQGVACAAAFVCAALRSTAFMGLFAALALGCNPAWLLLLARAPGMAAGLAAAIPVLTLLGAIWPVHARFLAIPAAVGVALLVAVTGWMSVGATDAIAPLLLVGATLGPFLGILALPPRLSQSWTVKALAMGTLALSLIALWLAVGGPASSSRRPIEEEQAGLAAQRAFQDLLRPFVRRAGHVVLWDQTARAPKFGPVTVLPRRFDISPYELSYALRHMNSPVIVVIACEERSDCSAAHGSLDAIELSTMALLNGGRLAIGSGDLHYVVVQLLPVKPP
ncbi:MULTISPECIES: hypothetical protein [unclassified Bosea (in: a-proteobacteria)]|uniref:hypothetical protein n=1 Tax=unclassified Bosea (in: a-proteobacteria) TaxID=2653178 RepID=UPI000F75FDF0|nr:MULTISPECIES: hypothetical protein [unclassified Bosea (in: a-proteobacteria)]AZO80964.1 hypothetical protein BLM15_27905 [Bosea sp. Tri-49]RXT25930.1 hypothetical protein B5U98_05065 [Bosea sp. Tri-39]RXT31172.1 hypothetical protein B5U99_20610 [Bosea sp. Tri-54]